MLIILSLQTAPNKNAQCSYDNIPLTITQKHGLGLSVSPEKLIEASRLFDHCVAETIVKIKKVQSNPHDAPHSTPHNEFETEELKDLVPGEFQVLMRIK